MAVIGIAAFFVISSLSLSNRLDEDYAPRNWRYRWILLDGSLALIYLMVFMAVSWLWRPVSLSSSSVYTRILPCTKLSFLLNPLPLTVIYAPLLRPLQRPPPDYYIHFSPNHVKAGLR